MRNAKSSTVLLKVDASCKTPWITNKPVTETVTTPLVSIVVPELVYIFKNPEENTLEYTPTNEGAVIIVPVLTTPPVFPIEPVIPRFPETIKDKYEIEL